MKVAVIGSAENPKNKKHIKLCENIGKYLCDKNLQILTGGSSGIPGLIVKNLNKVFNSAIAYSPDRNEKEHNLRHDNLNSEYFTEIKYFKGFTNRSLKMIEDSDFVLVVGGRMGTLSEFTIALEEGKKVLVIKGTGGITNHLEYIIKVAKKEFPNQVFFEKDYKKGIDKLVEIVEGVK